MATRRMLATLPNHPIAEMLAVTLREMGVPVTTTVGDLDGPNKLMPADLWLEDAAVMDDPEVAARVRGRRAPFLRERGAN